MSFVNTLGAEADLKQMLRNGTTAVSIENLHTFESLGEDALRKRRLLDSVCSDNWLINLPF